MRSIVFVAQFCLAAIVLCQITGCGGDEETTSTTAPDTSTASDSTATAPESGANASAVQDPSVSTASDSTDVAEGGHGAEGMAESGGSFGESSPGGYPGAGAGGYPGSGAYPGSGGDDATMTDGTMTAGYGATGGENGAGYGSAGNSGNQNGRPNDVGQWTDEQILTAVEERDSRVIAAIERKSQGSGGDPAFVPLMEQVLAKSGSSSGGDASFAFPGLPGAAPGGAPPVAAPPPARRQGVPPGGASLAPAYRRASSVRPLGSMELMIGESLLSFVPQAVQGTRNAADNLQNAAAGAGGNTNSSAAQQMQASGAAQANPGGVDPTLSQQMQSGAGYPGAGNAGGDYPSAGASAGYESGGGGYGRQNNTTGILDDRQLIESVVRGLVKNNTPQAWSLIEGIASGKVSTSLSSDSNTEIVVQEVFSDPTPNVSKAQALLASALATALQKPEDNPGTLRILAAVAKRPADHFLSMATPSLPPPPPGPSGQNPQAGTANGYPGSGAAMSSEAGAGYAGAGYSAAGPSTETADSTYSNEGFGGDGQTSNGLGAPTAFAAPPPLEIPVADAILLPVVTALWAPGTSNRVASLLQLEASAAGALDLLSLASTIPSDTIRHATFNLLSQSHAEGAEDLIRSGLFRHVARDPGMLTVLKALPRERPAAENSPPTAATGPGASWVNATLDSVISLRDRLAGVSSDASLAFTGTLPIRLHKDAVPERSIVIEVPGGSAESLGESSPSKTKIYYTRVQVAPQQPKDMQDIVDYYEKRTKGYKREDRSRGILWYDGVRANGDGTSQTMDVIVQQVGAQRGGGGNAGFGNSGGYESGAGGSGFGGGQSAGGAGQYTVEIIIVIARDPSKPADDAVTATSP